MSARPVGKKKLGEYRGRSASAPRIDVRAALAAEPGRLRRVALDDIVTNPDQPRKRFDPTRLQELADSISEVGILQPPVVADTTDGLLLIAGERRCRAARLAGLTHVDVLIRDEAADSDMQRLELALLENAARENLTPIEEARTYSELINGLGVSHAVLARRVGKSKSEVTNTMRLLDLPDEVLELVEAGRLAKSLARTLLSEPDHGRRWELARRAVTEDWTRRRLEQEISVSADAREPRRPNADHVAVAQRLGDELGRKLGMELEIKPNRDGFTIKLPDLAAAREFAARIGIDEADLDI